MCHWLACCSRGLVVAAVLTGIGCRVERLDPGPPTRQADADLIAALESYYDALSDRDWTRFADHFWPGAVLTTVWQPPGETAARVVATSVPDFVAQAPQGPGSKPIFEERMTGAPLLRVHRDLAQAWVRYRARFGAPGDVMAWEGIDAFLLIRHEGRWRIAALAFAAVDG